MADNMEHAFANARAWYSEIKELLQKLEAVNEPDYEGEESEDSVRCQIQEGPLSVAVRDGWRQPGAPSEGADEYEILLSTGGPALRIIGDLSNGSPTSAELQAQDWGTPWTLVPDVEEDILLSYAQNFYFED